MARQVLGNAQRHGFNKEWAEGAEAATKVLPHGMILKAMSMIEKITKE